jgi:hypothetical protein
MFGIISRDYRVIPEASHILQFNSAFDNLLGVLFFGIIISAGTMAPATGAGLAGLLFSVTVPILAVILYTVLVVELSTPEERFLLLLGLLFLADGIALHFNQSLIFISFLFGFGLANSPVKTSEMLLDVAKLEKPMYVLLLVFVGTMLNYAADIYLLVFFLFFIIHLFSKLLSGYITQFIVPEKYRLGAWGGLANLGLGGLPLAIILDFYLIKNNEIVVIFLFAITITLVLQDAFSWFYLRKSITKERRQERTFSFIMKKDK